MRTPLRWLGLPSALLLAAPLPAHHSLGAVYDGSREVAVEGTVIEFHFVHPHPVLVVEAREAGGRTRSWRAEMDNRFELEAIGITGSTFRAGDEVRISGNPGRQKPDILYVWKLERPSDGLRYEQVGSTPTLRRRGTS